LSGQIADTVEEFLGVRLTVHRFRHLIGYIYLQENPGGHEVVRQLLGYRDIQTTLQFYASMETQKAIAHYDDFLNQRRVKLSKMSADDQTPCANDQHMRCIQGLSSNGTGLLGEDGDDPRQDDGNTASCRSA
jgi:hypothetical protein